MPRDVHASSLGTATTLPTRTDCLAGLLELGIEKATWINYERKGRLLKRVAHSSTPRCLHLHVSLKPGAVHVKFNFWRYSHANGNSVESRCSVFIVLKMAIYLRYSQAVTTPNPTLLENMSNAPVSLPSNGTSSDTDIYAPLDGNQQSIRLFRIIPGTGLLNLELKQVCLESDECPPFAALSYMWGKNPTHQEIIINGNDFRVTQNAFRFLETLRQHQVYASKMECKDSHGLILIVIHMVCRGPWGRRIG